MDQWVNLLRLSDAYICISKLTIISSDNALSPGQAPSHYLNQCWNVVSWTLRNKLQWNLQRFSFKKMHLKISAKWCPFCRSFIAHIFAGNLTIIGSGNDLSPGQRQAITWTDAGILLIGPLWTNNFSEILIETHTFSFKKMHLKRLSAKWRTFCLGLSVLILLCWSWLLMAWHLMSPGLQLKTCWVPNVYHFFHSATLIFHLHWT